MINDDMKDDLYHDMESLVQDRLIFASEADGVMEAVEEHADRRCARMLRALNIELERKWGSGEGLLGWLDEMADRVDPDVNREDEAS